MRRRYKVLLLLISFIIASLLVYGMYIIQRHYIKAEHTIEVFIANKWLGIGHIISNEDVEKVNYPSDLVSKEMYVNLEDVLNKEIVIPLGKDEPILNWKLNTYHLLPQDNEATFQIPTPYILSIANDIRAGDYVYLYKSGVDLRSEKLFEQPIKVASVKNSSNVEIESTTLNELEARLHSNERALYEHRRFANGAIEYINLNLTEQQWLAIDELCRGGEAKLIIAYTPYYIESSTGKDG